MTSVRLERLKRFLQSAGVLAERSHPLFEEALKTLPSVTGLSTENVEWALRNALESDPSRWDLELLLHRVPECPRAHVLLSANVFVGSLRAIALGIGASGEVHVRPSRREPQMVELLAKATHGQFIVDQELRVSPGDHVWAYGSDETMAVLGKSLPAGSVLHAHGHGFGLVVLAADEVKDPTERQRVARAIAVDVAAFDQRGCLSPRIVVVEGETPTVKEIAVSLAEALVEREQAVPMGTSLREERAEVLRYRDMMCVAATVLDAGSGFVSFENESLPFVLPPSGRVLHVKRVTHASEYVSPLASKITAIGVVGLESQRTHRLRLKLRRARFSEIGAMQCPRLDGPVDLRAFL